MNTYNGLITSLESNDIFVFGSNTQGRHGKGAALWAIKNAGAIYGQARGLQGMSYAIVTKDLTKSIHPSISKQDIIFQIIDLYDYAEIMPNNRFMVAYSGSGINLNGYTNSEMAVMFQLAARNSIPANIYFEAGFADLMYNPKTVKYES